MRTIEYHRIESRHNERYKSLTRLALSGKDRRRSRKIILDGVHLIQSYIEHFGTDGMDVFVSGAAAARPEVNTLLGRISPQQISFLGDALMQELALGDTPTGIVAAAALPSVVAHRTVGNAFWVALEGVQDPGNMGSIMRSAAATGVNQLLLAKGCTDPWSPKCLRGGMGAHFLLPVLSQVFIRDTLSMFGGRIIATVPRGGKSLYQVDLHDDVMLLFGGEGSGLSDEALSLATEQVSLPMSAHMESVNLAAAVAACCFERVRQIQCAESRKQRPATYEQVQSAS